MSKNRMALLKHGRTSVIFFISSVISAALVIGGYEIIKNIQYYRWKNDLDNSGWLGKITTPSSNPVLMWEYAPYGEFEKIKTNRFGFRDFDYESTTKPDDTYRIAFAGDSITLGWGVEASESFVQRFETWANLLNNNLKVQALNFSVDGYNALQVHEMIKQKVLSFSPDKVIYVMCLNDFDFEASSGGKILYFRKPKSFFLEMLEDNYQRYFQPGYHQYHFSINKNEVFRSILYTKNLLEKIGIEFQLVIMPIFTKSFDNYPAQNIHDETSGFLKKHEIPYIDLLERFSLSKESPIYYAADIWHPNANGHSYIAQQLISLNVMNQ